MQGWAHRREQEQVRFAAILLIATISVAQDAAYKLGPGGQMTIDDYTTAHTTGYKTLVECTGNSHLVVEKPVYKCMAGPAPKLHIEGKSERRMEPFGWYPVSDPPMVMSEWITHVEIKTSQLPNTIPFVKVKKAGR